MNFNGLIKFLSLDFYLQSSIIRLLVIKNYLTFFDSDLEKGKLKYLATAIGENESRGLYVTSAKPIVCCERSFDNDF